MRLPIFFFAILLMAACSDDDNATHKSRTVDIEITVDGTTKGVLRKIKATVTGPDLNLSNSHTGNTSSSYVKLYEDVEVPDGASVDIYYSDLSKETSFQPYVVTIAVKVNGEVVLLESRDVNVFSAEVSSNYALDEYFKSR